MRFLIVLVAGMFATFLVPETEAQQLPLTLDKGWTIPLIGKYGRSAVVQDEMLFRLTTHSFRSPHDADTLIAPDGVIYHWKRVNADDKGWFKNSDLRGGYLYAEVKFSKPSIAILEATGQQEVFVNGTPRGGDVYGYGWIQHPVKFHRGNNVLLFHVARGRVKASVTSPPHPVFLSDRDLLIPDWITDTTTVTLGAVRVINATNRILKGWIVRCMDSAGNFADIAMPPVSSLSSRKVKFKLPNSKIPKETVGHTKEVKLILLDAGHTIQGDPNGMSVRIQVKTPRQKHKKTFVSEIDGSVQYFSIVPSSLPKNGQALFLTLHGASVEAVNQANAYKSKDWGTIVAPTNRRPYGFDWEDWGRLDAMEVLQFAIQQYHPDPDRIYLTGHSMGGHGTWQVGVTYPDRWAAIAPSAGWYSFWSYAGKVLLENPGPVDQMLYRASNSSNTLGMIDNYKHYGIYILHGDADDNVPVTQARFMREQLGKFHPDFCYYERPGAGHWWGNQCVDWPPLFDFLKIHRRINDSLVTHLEFVTANPGISSSSHFVTIWQQIHSGEFSSFRMTQDMGDHKIGIETKNTALLMIRTDHFAKGTVINCQIDNTEFQINTGSSPIWFRNEGEQWVRVGKIPLWEKSPVRGGGFKDAFRHHMVFVYGTTGNRDENKWAFDKARFDAETFWYRGNGSVDVIADRDFVPDDNPDCNIILYGNTETNSAYRILLDTCPVQIDRKQVRVGTRVYRADNLGVYFIYPRKGTSNRSVGVIAGTGSRGMGAVWPNRYFTSGSGFPDLMVVSSEMLERGSSGILLAGYFGQDWSVINGDWSDR